MFLGIPYSVGGGSAPQLKVTGNVFFAFIFIDPPGWVKSQPYNSRSKLRVSDYIRTSPGIVGRRFRQAYTYD